jgi:ABC-2 type transport system ATP-binding protein
LIEFLDVHKSYKAFQAVRGVTFTIEDKEVFGLLGPNGAGKSTLIMTMATVYRPTSGDIRVDGHSVLKEPGKVKELIGISFQDPKYDRILSAREILEWHARVTGVERQEARRRIDEVLGKFGILEEANKRTWMLSGGTKKKIENAKVFVQRPKVAVFDEPTAYLDVPSRLMVWNMIDELRQEGTTVLLATNMMDEADRMSDRVGIVNRGQMAKVGTPSELKASLKGKDIIELKLSKNASLFVNELEQIDEVESVALLDEEDDALSIYLSNGRTLLPLIINKISSKGGVIQSVSLNEPTLEDVFLNYTGSKLA